MNKNKKLGFTLAEVLIVIGIIGVVAALTLPNLNHATGDKEKVTKVKKIYSNLTEAVDRAQAIYGPFDTWFKDLSTNDEKSARMAKRITEFLKVSKDCGNESGCFSTAPLLDFYGEIDYESLSDYISDDYMVALSDGVSIAFYFNDGINKITVDIDGPNKGKNQMGNDIFDFSIYVDEDGAIEDGANINQLYPSACPNGWIGGSFSNYLTVWVIENGNLDYLKCPEELDLDNWEKTSCN